MISSKPVNSYKSDPNVPDFAHDGPFTVMDAHCGLCAKGAAWIARNDTLDEFRIIPIQSTLGKSLLAHYGLDADDPTTWLYVSDGRAYVSFDAIIRVADRMGRWWKLTNVLRIFPSFILNPVYRLIARNRYRFFGRTDMCDMPNPDLRRKLLE